jgi:MFS family permease
MLISYPAGALSDRVGRLPLLIGGWSLRVLALAALATVRPEGVLLWVLFISYSVTLAITEPAERALVGDVAPAELRGTTYGLYNFTSGLFVLPGAVLFGLIWQRANSGTAYGVAAFVTALAALSMAFAAHAARRAKDAR